jgi:hypothetical protein
MVTFESKRDSVRFRSYDKQAKGKKTEQAQPSVFLSSFTGGCIFSTNRG